MPLEEKKEKLRDIMSKIEAILPRGWSCYGAEYASHVIINLYLRKENEFRVAYYSLLSSQFLIFDVLEPAPPSHEKIQKSIRKWFK